MGYRHFAITQRKKHMLFIPSVYTEHGGSLPRTDPRAKTDFIGQHVKHDWSESDAVARYELWVARAIDTNPERRCCRNRGASRWTDVYVQRSG